MNIGNRTFYPEHETVVVGKLGFGYIEGWAKATSKPFGSAVRPTRPEVSGPPRPKAQLVTSLRRVEEFEKAKARIQSPKAEVVVMPIETETKKVSRDIERTMDICDFINAKLGLCAMKPNLQKKVIT